MRTFFIRSFLISIFPILGDSYIFNNFSWIDLTGDTTSFQDELVYWKVGAVSGISQNFTTCEGSPYIGGYGDNGNFSERIYDGLPAHKIIYFSLYFIVLDSWNSYDYFGLVFDSQEIKFQNFTNGYTDFGTGACQIPGKKGNGLRIVGRVPHNNSQLVFRLISYLDAASTVKSFGFRDILFFFFSENNPTSSHICGYCNYPLRNNRNCSCSEGNYLAADGLCKPCHTHCSHCYGALASECYKCKTGRFYNGTHCKPCYSGCNVCYKDTINGCKICSSTKFVLDGICVDECNSPLIGTSTPYKICTYKCNSNQILYSDGSCRDFCLPPLRTYVNYTKIFCENPCSHNSSLLYYNGSCLGLLSCSYPLKMKLLGPFQVCDLPCKVEEIFMYNGSCLPLSSCVVPRLHKVYGEVDVCEHPCLNPSDFIYWNNTCHSSCPLNFQHQMIDNLKFCKPSKCGTVLCKLCQIDGDCMYGYYCDKTYGEGICLPYNSYYLHGALMNTVLNGYIIRVEVSPAFSLTDKDENDYLLYSISSLKNDLDYTVNIHRLSQGIFDLKLKILKPLETDTISINFTYYSLTLTLNTALDVPMITFASSSLQKTAQIVQTSSYVSFAILTVNIIGYAMTGGLSALWAFLPENQYAYYFIYLNVNYPHHIKVYLRTFRINVFNLEKNSRIEHSLKKLFVFRVFFFDIICIM